MSEYALTYQLAAVQETRDWELPPADFGRMLTLPEINDLRRGYDIADRRRNIPWNLAYLTASREYYGLSAGGVELICVRHGDGPSQADLDADPLAFRRLLDGAYGDVHVVEGRAIDAWEKSGRTIDHWEAEHPLTEARFGGTDAAQAFVKQCKFQARVYDPEGYISIWTTLPAVKETQDFGSKPHVARLSTMEVDRRIGGYFRLGIPAICDARLNSHYARFVALTDGDDVVGIAPPVTLQGIVEDPTRSAWIADGARTAGLTGLFESYGHLMTDTRETGLQWPGHKVLSFRRIGGPVHFETPADIEAYVVSNGIAANAYLAEHDKSGKTVAHVGHCAVDWSVRVPSADEFLYDWTARREITRAEGERWWRGRAGGDVADRRQGDIRDKQ